jgi:hypothetical protein
VLVDVTEGDGMLVVVADGMLMVVVDGMSVVRSLVVDSFEASDDDGLFQGNGSCRGCCGHVAALFCFSSWQRKLLSNFWQTT